MDLLLRQGVDRALTFDRDVAAPLCNDLLVDFLAVRGLVTDPRLAEAMRTHRRDLFLPDTDLRDVYTDRAVNLLDVPDGWMSTSGSAPSVVATMIEALDLPSDAPCRVLEIGTGSAYSTALLAGMGPNVEVVTVEILDDVRDVASERLAELGLHSVDVRAHGEDVFADGPFDRIVATCAFEALPAEWIGGLREGGVVVVPVDSFVYRLVRAGERLVGTPLMTAEFVVCRDRGPGAARDPVTMQGADGTVVWWGHTAALEHVVSGRRPSMRVELPMLTPHRVAAARLRLEASGMGAPFTFSGSSEWGFGVTGPDGETACVCRLPGSLGFRHYPDAPGEVVVEMFGEPAAVRGLWEHFWPLLAADGPSVRDLRVEVAPADDADAADSSVVRGPHAWTYTLAPQPA